MFGDKLILGEYELNLDNKRRICIPPTTGREAGDQLILIYDKDIEYYRLYNIKDMDPVLEEYQKLIYNAETDEQKVLHKRRALEFAKSIIHQGRVGDHGRFCMCDCFEPNSTIEVIGAGRHLVLRKKQ